MNNALGHLGSVRLADVTEDRGDRRELDAVWTDATDFILEQGGWKFAMRSVELSADGDIEPSFGARQYAFTKPDDYVRLAGISGDEDFGTEMSEYDEQAGVIYSTLSTLYLRYVSKGDNFGYDMGAWPPTFCEAHGAYLAFKSAIPITQNGQTKDKLFAYAMKFISRAGELGALEQSVKFKPQGNWVSARGGGSVARRTRIQRGGMGW